jgi:hypothetical protein
MITKKDLKYFNNAILHISNQTIYYPHYSFIVPIDPNFSNTQLISITGSFLVSSFWGSIKVVLCIIKILFSLLVKYPMLHLREQKPHAHVNLMEQRARRPQRSTFLVGLNYALHFRFFHYSKKTHNASKYMSLSLKEASSNFEPNGTISIPIFKIQEMHSKL